MRPRSIRACRGGLLVALLLSSSEVGAAETITLGQETMAASCRARAKAALAFAAGQAGGEHPGPPKGHPTPYNIHRSEAYSLGGEYEINTNSAENLLSWMRRGEIGPSSRRQSLPDWVRPAPFARGYSTNQEFSQRDIPAAA